MDYSKYTFEDFLQDDFFVSSIKNKEESDHWEALIREGKINGEAFCSAKDFLESLEEQNENSVSNIELSLLWTKIQASNHTYIYYTRRKKYRKLILYIGSGAVASIIILCIVLFYIESIHQTGKQDIVSFAQANAVTENHKDIQIILSENKAIEIDETEADIVYDSTDIKIAQKEVSKKESSMYNQLIVPKGKRSKLILSDGTKLVVNAGTRIVYPIEFSGEKREIYVDGEVLIDVSYDKNKPFIVKTRELNIHVLGTKFNIMAYETDADKQVVLDRGSVKILRNNTSGEVLLKPSEMYECNNTQSRVVKVDVAYYTSWVDGIYIFRSQKLDDVALRLSRYYGVDIVCAEDAANYRCSGKMDLKDNLEDIFKGLSFSFPVKIEYSGDKYIIKKKA